MKRLSFGVEAPGRSRGPVRYGDTAAQTELRQVEEEIDRAAAQLWGLMKEELRG